MKLFLNTSQHVNKTPATPLKKVVNASNNSEVSNLTFGGYIKQAKRIIRVSKKANNHRKSRRDRAPQNRGKTTSLQPTPNVNTAPSFKAERFAELTQTLGVAVQQFKRDFDNHYKQDWLKKLEHFFFEVKDKNVKNQHVYTNLDGINMTPESAGLELITIHKALNSRNVDATFQAMLDVFHDVHHMYMHFKSNQLDFPEPMRESFLIAAEAVEKTARQHNLVLEFPPHFLQY